MPSNVDAGPEPQPGVVSDDFVQLTVNVLFDRIPRVTDSDDSTHELAMKPVSPILRFPVQLSAKDAGVVQEAFQAADVAGVAFQIDDTHGSPRYYRLFRVQ